jgi:hypothetical protein
LAAVALAEGLGKGAAAARRAALGVRRPAGNCPTVFCSIVLHPSALAAPRRPSGVLAWPRGRARRSRRRGPHPRASSCCLAPRQGAAPRLNRRASA